MFRKFEEMPERGRCHYSVDLYPQSVKQNKII